MMWAMTKRNVVILVVVKFSASSVGFASRVLIATVSYEKGDNHGRYK
jgi:hypothetical protein